MKLCKETEAKSKKKATELEAKMKDSKGYKEKQLKEAESEMKKMKQKADKRHKEWKQREQDYESLNLEISELKKGLANIQQQIQTCVDTISRLQKEYEEMSNGTSDLKVRK